ncbi:ABC transporter ATP-binding protein [Georgenia sp. TF02-10]|uniref:ABC transporter ATP-binding protein n=1 Tax=Georgenia sp. TF02-10 TaxID=2917725 RepID=UPI001FA78627|nr:ABC transporter ATP-binding protein [Georgenia sp. TF02-10]UNX53265.1 ABC transporter ATP-binding protein [Georgenia sp. TF02-10]
MLTAHALVKTYGPTTALAGVDVVIRAGEAVAVMGASGSGKTTLLHCLAGIITPDSGAVHLHLPGERVPVNELGEGQRSRLRREQFGFVFQDGLLLPELSAVENVAIALMLTGVPRQAAEQAAAGWLHALGLAGLEDRRIGQLSGGQAQRVAIARAQVTGARVVFADEPTGALDSRTSAEVLDVLLASTAQAGRALVVVTHDPQVAARCDRTVYLSDGRVVPDGGTPGTEQVGVSAGQVPAGQAGAPTGYRS